MIWVVSTKGLCLLARRLLVEACLDLSARKSTEVSSSWLGIEMNLPRFLPGEDLSGDGSNWVDWSKRLRDGDGVPAILGGDFGGDGVFGGDLLGDFFFGDSFLLFEAEVGFS